MIKLMEESSMKSQDIADDLRVGILICRKDEHLSIEEVNSGFLVLSGYRIQEIEDCYRNQLADIIHPHDRQRVLLDLMEWNRNQERMVCCFRLVCKDGINLWVQYFGKIISGAAGEEKILCIITERIIDQEEERGFLRIRDGLSPFLKDLDKAADQSGVMIFEWDIVTDILAYSADFQNSAHIIREISSYLASASHIHPEDHQVLITLHDSVKQGKLYSTSEFRIRKEESGYTWYRIHVITQYDSKDMPAKAVGMIFCINDEMEVMEQLRARAERDVLTGLYNREETEGRIKGHLQGKPSQCCALLMIDTDNFKQINDSQGHMLGDVVLSELAASMKNRMRESDIVGRVGGDEFIIFMKDISSREAARNKTEELLKGFSHLFQNEKMAIQITCSIGIAVYPEDGNEFKTLYRHADQALYQAKTQGKNQFVMYDHQHSFPIEEAGYSNLVTAIDSETKTAELSNNILTDIFRILYRTEDTDQAINMTLEIVGRRFDVSRAYIFESAEDGKFHTNTYEWCNKGISPQMQNLQNVDFNEAGDYKTMFDDNSIFYCRDTHLLPATQRELLEKQGIYSTLQCAFWKEKEFAGFVGFDECTGLRLWTKEEADVLSLVSQMLTTFLQKKRVMERNAEMELQMRTILDSQSSCIYIVEKNTFKLLFLNLKARELNQGIRCGECCYEALFNQEKPCGFCPLTDHGIGEGDMEDSIGKSIEKKKIHHKMHASSTKWFGKEAYLISFRTEKNNRLPDTRQNMEHYISAEKSLVDCIQCLTSAEYLEDAIEYVLDIVQDYYQSDRVYIIELDEEKGIAINTYEICAEGVEPQRQILQNVPLEAISFWMEQFEIRGYINIEDVNELGAERQMEGEILKEQEINSLMAIPLYVKGEIKGFLGIDDPKIHKENFYYLKELTYFLENEIAKNSLKKKLVKMSYQDSMTGLENRNSYMNFCDEFSEGHPAPIGVIFMDINGLKKLNDSKGHLCGNMLITHIGEKMKEFFPKERCFRLSGDEFLIVTKTMAYDEFRKQLNHLTDTLSEDGQSSIAIGTTWSDVDADLIDLVNKADRLMYINKQDYYKETKDIADTKIPLLRGLLESILNHEYLIYLQPKYHVQTGIIDSAEVLVRYREKDGSISSPVKFIPMLESEGLISNIDFFVMEEVCRLLTKWNDTQLANMKLALNFSRITLFEDHFLTQFQEIFNRYKLKPQQLEVEVTETQETLNKKQMAQLLDALSSHGFRIALDDFGVEYSSYEFLLMADFNLLKIDKGIVQKYGNNEKSEILMKHIVKMGHELGISCCAEGVETEEQFQFMKEIGCDYIQGYLIGRPVSVEQFEMRYMGR